MLNFFEMTELLKNEVIEFDRDNHGTGGRTTRAKAQLSADDPESLRDIGAKGSSKGDYWMKWMDKPEEELSRHDGTSQELARIKLPGANLARQIYHAINHHINKFQHKSFTFPQLVQLLSSLEIKDVDGSFKTLGVGEPNQQWATAIKLLSGATQPAISAPVFRLNKGSQTISIAEEHPTLTKAAQEHLNKLKGSEAKADFKDRYFDKDESDKAKPGIRYLNQRVNPAETPAEAGDMPAPIKAKLDQEKKMFAKVVDHLDMVKTTGYGGKDDEEMYAIIEPYEGLVKELLDNGWVKRDRQTYDTLSQNYSHIRQLSKEVWGNIGKESPEKEAYKSIEEYFHTVRANAGNEDKSAVKRAYEVAKAALDKALNDPGLSRHSATMERLSTLKAKLEKEQSTQTRPATPSPTAGAPSVPTKPAAPPPAPAPAAKPPVKRTFLRPSDKPTPGNKDFSNIKTNITDDPFR